MRLIGGLTEWRSDLGKIYATAEVRGFEKYFDLAIFALTILIPSQILQIWFWGRRDRVPAWFAEVYVGAATILLLGLLWWSDVVPWVSAAVAFYLLANIIIVLLNVLFLTKLTFIGGVASKERTLLLFMFNVVQVVLIFAIFYRLQLPHLSARDALFKTLLVFGTIGYPSGAEAIVGLQIAIDFLLLAVFLAVFVGSLGTRERKNKEEKERG
jgi:hypothetical protein